MKIGDLVIGIIMIVIAFLMFGIVLDATDTLLAWSGTGGTALEDFTGLSAIITIAPLLIFLGLLAGGGWLTFRGITGGGEGRAGRRLR